jgi:hypothetical protein
MNTGELLVAPPAPDTTDRVLCAIGSILELDVCWLYQCVYSFRLGYGREIRVSPDDAGRFRLSAWQDGREVATLWTLGRDPGRLAGAVGELAEALGVIA